MTLAAFPDRPTHRCDPRGCTHATCEGCGATCGPDDGWKTTTGGKPVRIIPRIMGLSPSYSMQGV